MTEITNIVTGYNKAKEFERKRNGMIGYFSEIIDRNPEVCLVSLTGVILGTLLWIKGNFLFDPCMSWSNLFMFLVIWFVVTVVGWWVVSALNFAFDWAHDRERARDLLYAAYYMDSADAACEIACNWDRYGRYVKYCNKYFDMVAIRQSQEEWYHKAANQGHAVAQYRLGNWYVSCAAGTGRYADAEAVKEAVMWYRKAAEQGYADAQCCLGKCYAEGVGVEKDEAEAVKWYRKAAESGSTVAQCNLAKCYEDGIGVEKDESEAKKWYRKAFAQGSLQAKWHLI